MIIGLEGAHPACAGPLIELLLEEGAPVRVCFAAHELLEAPEDARVVLLHAARDADFLNMARPVVSERRLRVLVWLRPGDRRELSRRARDFLDWMQESVDVPEFMPRYAEEALRRTIEEGTSISWEGPPVGELVRDLPILFPFIADDVEAITAMRKGPVVIHRPRDADEIGRFEAMHRAAGSGFGIIWEEPAVLPVGTERIIAEPLEWELAAEALEKAEVADPRIEAARLHLDPVEISRLAGMEPPALPTPEPRPELYAIAEPNDASLRGPQPQSSVSRGGSMDPRVWWAAAVRICKPSGPPKDTALIVQRPAVWAGLGPVEDRLRARTETEIHLVTGGPGIGVSTELRSLALRLRQQRCVVTLDVSQALGSQRQGRRAGGRLTAWELMLELGLAAIRVGERWGVRWDKELHRLNRAIHRAAGTSFDAQGPKEELARIVGLIVAELRVVTGQDVVLVVDGLEREPRLLIDELTGALKRSSLQGLHADMVLAVREEHPSRSLRVAHGQTLSHLDDVPVLDVHNLSAHGPGIAFLRELLERRLASIAHDGFSVPAEILDQLGWASGGRPSECLRLMCDLAMRAHDEPLARLQELMVPVLRTRRRELVRVSSREGHMVLASLLERFVTEVPNDETARELYSLGLLRLYPTPEAGYRALPHPLLIEEVQRG